MIPRSDSLLHATLVAHNLKRFGGYLPQRSAQGGGLADVYQEVEREQVVRDLLQLRRATAKDHPMLRWLQCSHHGRDNLPRPLHRRLQQRLNLIAWRREGARPARRRYPPVRPLVARAAADRVRLEILAGHGAIACPRQHQAMMRGHYQELVMTPADIDLQRLSQQRLAGHHVATPEEVVGWFGAVQSQEYLGAIWSLGMRMGGETTDDVIERAFTEGTILRTHVMRPTWHFVAPADIRWLLALTAPRIKATMSYYDRQLDLDDTLYARSNEVIARALEGGKHLTRAELGKALAEANIVVAGQRLAHIVSHAELDAVVCSGPRRGKQFTYALLVERAPTARTLPRDEALAELTQRYFTSHGPATARDFAWWSGLTMADAQTGLKMVGSDLTHEEIAGQTYWFPASLSPAPDASEVAFLLPTYDELLVGYHGFGAALTGGNGNGERAAFSATMVISGRVVGNWRRTITRGAVVIELAPFAPLTASEREAVSIAAGRYGAFLGLPVECVGL